MATTNLNLTTIAGTDNPANFPATYNDAMGKIDDYAGSSIKRKAFSVGANTSKSFTASGAFRALLLTFGVASNMLGAHMIARNNSSNPGAMAFATVLSANKCAVAVSTNTVTVTVSTSATASCQFLIFAGDVTEAAT